MKRYYPCLFDPSHGDLGSPLGISHHYRDEHEGRKPVSVRCVPCGMVLVAGGLRGHVRERHGKVNYGLYWQPVDLPWEAPTVEQAQAQLVLAEPTHLPQKPCPRCSVMIASKNLPRHLRSCRGKPRTKAVVVAEPAPVAPDPLPHVEVGADDIVIPVISELVGGVLPTAHLDAVFRWRDETARMLKEIRR